MSSSCPNSARGTLGDEPIAQSSKAFPIVSSFDDFNLKVDLLRGIHSYGLEKPTVIQQRAIPLITQGRNVIIQAESDHDRTTMFSISILQSIDVAIRETQVLVLLPTRELATCRRSVITALGGPMNAQSHVCTGGIEDSREFEHGQHIVLGTPGRVFDAIQRRGLSTRSVRILVLDEADEILDRGFKDQVDGIYRCLLPTTQIAFVSTTLPHDVSELAIKFMADPIHIPVERNESALEGIKQFFLAVEKEEWKFETLCDLLGVLTNTKVIILCNTREKVDWLVQEMHAVGFSLPALHVEMTQAERDVILTEFHGGISRGLIIADDSAELIGTQQATLIIGYDLPPNRENYLHRISQLGQVASRGIVTNFVTVQDVQTLRDIEKYYSVQIEEMPLNVAELL